MIGFLLRLSAWLPPGMRAHATQARLELLTQFCMFGTVGLIGLVLDTAAVYGLRSLLGLYGAGLVAFFVAASGTWFCNRTWTFRGQGGTAPWYRQWIRFLGANMSGFVLNRGVYTILVTFVAAAAREPVIAVAAGAVAGMTVNFNMSRRLVFR